LERAEIILHDSIVPEEILSLAPQARFEAHGKRSGEKRTRQPRINQHSIDLARRRARAMRLKGCDPLLFCTRRGGGYGARLRRHPIPHSAGISAGIGGRASAGVRLTQRGDPRERFREWRQTALVTFICAWQQSWAVA